MEWFCTDEERLSLKRREKQFTVVFRILLCLTVITFIALCLLVRTENAQMIHRALILTTTILGWICILLWMLGVKESRTQLAHLDMLREGKKEFLEGTVTLTQESIQIPKSIRIRKVLLDAGEQEPRRLNLDEKWINRLPRDGSKVCLALTHSYISGVELLEKAGGTNPESGRNRKPGKGRKVLKLLPLLGIWTITAVIFSSFIFFQITETDPVHKITIYVDGEVRDESQLAALLEKELPEPIRMVQIHPFRYAMFGSAALKSADLFVIPDSEKEQFADWLFPEIKGVPVHDPQTRLSVAGDWFLYEPQETYMLYLGAASAHLEDGLAHRTATLLLELKSETEELP